MTMDLTQTRFAGFHLVKHASTDLFLNNCGMEDCLPGSYVQDIVRLEYIIHFVIRGHGTLRLFGREYVLGPSCAFLIPPDTADYFYQSDLEDPMYYIWIGFYGSKVISYLNRTSLSVQTPVCPLAIPVERFYSLINQMLHTSSQSICAEFHRTGCLHLLLSALMDSHYLLHKEAAPQHPSQAYIKYAVDYINDKNGRTHIVEIAKHIGIDRSYLHRIFKNYFGISPQEYLVTFRLLRSENLLLSTTLTLQEIASEIGYEEAAGFSRTFKKSFGISPSAYRNGMPPERRPSLEPILQIL